MGSGGGLAGSDGFGTVARSQPSPVVSTTVQAGGHGVTKTISERGLQVRMADRSALSASVVTAVTTARTTFEETFAHGRRVQTGDLRLMRNVLEDAEDQARFVHNRNQLANAITSGAESPDYLRGLMARAGII